jgi:hypothetical protein
MQHQGLTRPNSVQIFAAPVDNRWCVQSDACEGAVSTVFAACWSQLFTLDPSWHLRPMSRVVASGSVVRAQQGTWTKGETYFLSVAVAVGWRHEMSYLRYRGRIALLTASAGELHEMLRISAFAVAGLTLCALHSRCKHCTVLYCTWLALPRPNDAHATQDAYLWGVMDYQTKKLRVSLYFVKYTETRFK